MSELVSDDSTPPRIVSITVAFGFNPAGATAWIVSPTRKKIPAGASVQWNLLPFWPLTVPLVSFAGPLTTPPGKGPGGSGLYFTDEDFQKKVDPLMLSPSLYHAHQPHLSSRGSDLLPSIPVRYAYTVEVIYLGNLYSFDPEAEWEQI